MSDRFATLRTEDALIFASAPPIQEANVPMLMASVGSVSFIGFVLFAVAVGTLPLSLPPFLLIALVGGVATVVARYGGPELSARQICLGARLTVVHKRFDRRPRGAELAEVLERPIEAPTEEIILPWTDIEELRVDGQQMEVIRVGKPVVTMDLRNLDAEQARQVLTEIQVVWRRMRRAATDVGAAQEGLEAIRGLAEHADG